MSFTRTAQRHALLKPLAASVIVILLVIAVADPGIRSLWWTQSAGAVGGYTATEGLGFLDASDEMHFGPVRNGAQNRTGIETQGGLLPANAIDTVGNYLFVADSGAHRVLVFELDAGHNLVDRKADFVIGQPDFFTDNTSGATAAGLFDPTAIAVDESGRRLFVAQPGLNNVRVFDITTITDGESAVNVLGQPDFTTTSTGTTQSKFNFPSGLVYDSGGDRLFVADSSNNRIMVFDVASISDGENAVNVLGQTDFTTATSGTTQAKLSGPRNLAYDSSGSRLFVADTTNNRVMVFDVASISDGENAVNVLGQTDFTTATSGTTQAKFNEPHGTAYDSSGNRLFVSDENNNRVMVFDVASISDGENAVNVLGQTDFTTATSGTTQAKFWAPRGMSYDGDNTLLYVADATNNRVMVFDVAAITDGENATDALGQLDEAGNPLYTYRVRQDKANAQQFSGPEDIIIDTVNHRMYISDASNNRVLVFNLATDDTINDRNADFVLGQSDMKSTSAATTQTGLSAPAGLAIDTSGSRLFVADRNNNRIMVWDTSALSNGASASFVLGQADFTSSGAATTQAGLSSPRGIEYDSVGDRLFVAEASNNRVTVFDVASISDGENAVNVLGQTDFTTNSGGTTQAKFDAPYGATYDTTNSRLFVPDFNNNRVMVFDVASISDGENAVNVLGQTDFTSNGEGGSSDKLHFNAVLIFTVIQPSYDDAQSRLFVPDYENHRVMVFDVASITDGEDAVDVVGQANFTDVSADAGGTVSASGLNQPEATYFDSTNSLLYVTDNVNDRILVFTLASATPTPTATSAGGPPVIPPGTGFFPESIEVNDDETVTGNRNVFVTIRARNSSNFTGTVDVLLSNDPSFSTFIPFRYNIPETGPSGPISDIWPKTVAWDLCWGLSGGACDPGQKTVYARFYVNIPAPSPVFTPLTTQAPLVSPVSTSSASVEEVLEE